MFAEGKGGGVNLYACMLQPPAEALHQPVVKKWEKVFKVLNPKLS